MTTTVIPGTVPAEVLGAGPCHIPHQFADDLRALVAALDWARAYAHEADRTNAGRENSKQHATRRSPSPSRPGTSRSSASRKTSDRPGNAARLRRSARPYRPMTTHTARRHEHTSGQTIVGIVWMLSQWQLEIAALMISVAVAVLAPPWATLTVSVAAVGSAALIPSLCRMVVHLIHAARVRRAWNRACVYAGGQPFTTPPCSRVRRVTARRYVPHPRPQRHRR